jgi:hypothetical protein
MVDAGRDQGRAATSHFFKAVLSVVCEGVLSIPEYIPQAWESGKRAPAFMPGSLEVDFGAVRSYAWFSRTLERRKPDTGERSCCP